VENHLVIQEIKANQLKNKDNGQLQSKPFAGASSNQMKDAQDDHDKKCCNNNTTETSQIANYKKTRSVVNCEALYDSKVHTKEDTPKTDSMSHQETSKEDKVGS